MGASEAKGSEPITGTITRKEVARRLGIAISSVRRLEGRALRPRVDDGGVHRFDPAEVEAYRLAGGPPLPRARKANAGGEKLGTASVDAIGRRDARLFALFQAGKRHADVVMETKVSAEVVRRTYQDWRSGYGPPLEPALSTEVSADRLEAKEAVSGHVVPRSTV